jgi:hypothetical protein
MPKLSEADWQGLVTTHGARLRVVEWDEHDVVVGPPPLEEYGASFDASVLVRARGDATGLGDAEHNLSRRACVWPGLAELDRILALYPLAASDIAAAASDMAAPDDGAFVELQRTADGWRTAEGDPVAPEHVQVIDAAAKGARVRVWLVDGELVVMGPARAPRHSEARGLLAKGQAFESARLLALGGRLVPDADGWKALAERYPGLVPIAGDAVRELGSPGDARISKAPRFSRAP